jgi:hypothetical protein
MPQESGRIVPSARGRERLSETRAIRYTSLLMANSLSFDCKRSLAAV